jgi:hypothetical protein
MNADELKSVLDLHAKWLRGEEGGSRANLYGADLYGADLSDANLYGADLSGADLSYANLIGADLRGADLSRADLRRANLIGANLYGAYLSGANLVGANGIISFGPIGKSKRIGYAWLDKDSKVMFHLGCHNGNLKETVTAICEKYDLKSNYEAVVRACAKALEEA